MNKVKDLVKRLISESLPLMAEFDFLERRDLERLLGMGSGYILNFSNRTFQDFVSDSVKINIYEENYEANGTSKANRLRTFWKIAPDHQVGKLLYDLITYCEREISDSKDAELISRCKKIATKLQLASSSSGIEKLNDAVKSKDATVVLNSIQDAVRRNEPESALDRLHTFVVAFMRERCDLHRIPFDKSEPLHSILGKYVNELQKRAILETKMSSSILRQGAKTMDSFNDVRNNYSLAHPNRLLSQGEALLILGWVRCIIEFIIAVDKSPISGKDNRNGDGAQGNDLHL